MKGYFLRQTLYRTQTEVNPLEDSGQAWDIS